MLSILALAGSLSGGMSAAWANDPHPAPPPRPFDLNIPGRSSAMPATPRPSVAQTPAGTPGESPAESPPAQSQQADPAPRAVSNAPAPPRRPDIAPLSNPADEEDEEPTWPRRTPGQRDIPFEPRITPPDEVIANGISTDPGTSVRCLPATLHRVLNAVVQKYGAVRVTSTWRPAFRARRNSFHRRCQAVDFRVPGQSPREVLTFVKTLNDTGGHKVYWNGLVHVDTGPWRSW